MFFWTDKKLALSWLQMASQRHPEHWSRGTLPHGTQGRTFFFFFLFLLLLLSFFLSFFLSSSCRLSLVSKCLSALAACNLFSDALPSAVGWGQRTYAYYIPPTYTIHLRYIHRFTYHIHSPWDQINSMWACQKKTSKTYGKILKFPCSIYFRIIFGNYRAIILKCTNSSIYIFTPHDFPMMHS